MNYGIFIELEKGIEGLIHISEVSWTKNVQNLQDSYKVGESLESKVLFVDSGEQKISLGIKQLSDDPWEKISGFVRTTDFHWTKNPSHPREFVNEGDSIEYLVLEILEKERKVLLSLKDLSENPWESIKAKFNSGDKIKGSFEKMNDSGIVIKLKDEIEGLIPMDKISKDQKKNMVKPDDKNITLMLDDSNVDD